MQNVTFSVSPDVQMLHNLVTFNISWGQGTDVNFTLSFGDSSEDIEWNWEVFIHFIGLFYWPPVLKY